MCYTYRDYRKEEEARKKRQQELREQRAREVRQAQKKFADRGRVLVKS